MAARPSRILIISLRRIGDLLLTTPVIRSVRRAWPETQIDVLVFDGSAGIIAGNPDIDHILTMPQRPTAAESLPTDSAPVALLRHRGIHAERRPADCLRFCGRPMARRRNDGQ